MSSPEVKLLWHRICPSSDLWEGVALAVQINQIPIAIYRLSDGLYAIEDLCPHAFALLSGGLLDDGCIECPVHRAVFDIRSGTLRSGPGVRDLRVFATREVDGFVELQCQG